MAGKDYLPRTDGQLIIWFENFAAKISTYAAALGISAAEVTQLQTDLTSLRTKLNDVQTAKTNLASAVETKGISLANITKRIRDTVVVLKRKSTYNDAIGADLGVIVATGTNIAIELPTPEFQATVLPDKVRLDWVKGESDGIVIQSKRGAEADYSTIGRDTMSPFDDERLCISPGTPEVRMYRIRYLSGDDEVGNWSNEARVLFVK